MSRHGLLLGVLSVAAVLYSAAAQDLPYLVILPLYNGGLLSYLTTPAKAPDGSLNFQKAMVPQSADDTNYLQQWFQPTTGYPQDFTLFSWFNQDLFLDSTNGVVSLQSKSSQPSQRWMVDSWGRLCTIDMKYMAQYSIVGGYGGPASTFTLVPYATAVKGVNQFVFAPSAAVSTDVSINYLVPNGGSWCLDSNPLASLVKGAPNTPVLSLCNSANKQQAIQLLPPFMDGNPAVDVFPSTFRIKFKATGLCLSLTPPFGTVRNSGRDGNSVLQVDCEATYSETTWRWNSRGQLQSFLQLVGSQNQPIWVCLNFDSNTGALVGDSCSLKVTKNRFNVV